MDARKKYADEFHQITASNISSALSIHSHDRAVRQITTLTLGRTMEPFFIITINISTPKVQLEAKVAEQVIIS